MNYVVRQGEVTRVDGPYAEAKEVVGGWAIMEYPSLEEAAADQQSFAELHGILARDHGDLHPAPDLDRPRGARRVTDPGSAVPSPSAARIGGSRLKSGSLRWRGAGRDPTR